MKFRKDIVFSHVYDLVLLLSARKFFFFFFFFLYVTTIILERLNQSEPIVHT